MNETLTREMMDELLEKKIEMRNENFVEYVIDESQEITLSEESNVFEAIIEGRVNLRNNGYGDEVEVFVNEFLGQDDDCVVSLDGSASDDNIHIEKHIPDDTIILIDKQAIGRASPYDWKPWVVMNPAGVITVRNE